MEELAHKLFIFQKVYRLCLPLFVLVLNIVHNTKSNLFFYLSSMTIIKIELHIFPEIYYKNLIFFFYGDDNVLSRTSYELYQTKTLVLYDLVIELKKATRF